MCERREMNLGGIYVIGLTGGIASGKSTVSNMLSKLGAVVLDADLIAKEVTSPGSSGLQKLVDAFGKEILLPDGSLNRKKLAEIVFHDKDALRLLNSIVHPLVLQRIVTILDNLKRRAEEDGATKIVVLDAPLLLEVGAEKLADEVWVVSVDLECQVRRLMRREGFTREEAFSRINAQMPLSEKKRYADEVIDNNGTPEETEKRVKELWLGLRRKMEMRQRICD